nr:MAG TPA: major capsid protein [Caudoviricetes sp.]
MAKEKSITDLKEEKNNLSARSKEIIQKAREEKRQFTSDENEKLGDIQCRMAEINLEIEQRNEDNRGRKVPYVNAGNGKFSLRRAISNLVDGNQQNDIEAGIIENATTYHNMSGAQMADKRSIVVPVNMENRAAFTAATEAATGVIIDEEQQEMLLPLQSALVLARAGARFMTGLQGNIYWPEFSGANVFWEGENSEAKDGAGAFTKGNTFKPFRLTAYVDISKQLLVQENTSVETYIRQAIAVAIAQKIEKTAFSVDKGVENTPDGMFHTLNETVKGDMTWAQIVAMETNADIQNALFGNLAYILHPSLVGKAKTKVKDPSGAGGFIFTGNGDGQLNGYKALRTNNLPKGLRGTPADEDTEAVSGDEYGIVFGNWSDYFLGQWGGIELLVDPYTQALKGTVRLITNSYWNMGFVRKESFCIASMK